LWDFEGYAGILAAATTVESAYWRTVVPSSPTRQHMSACWSKNCDVAHTGLKTQCEPSCHLSKYDDAPNYGRTSQMSEILRAGRAYGNPKIRSSTIFKICKHDSTRYVCDSTSKLINCSTMCYLSSTLSPTFYTFRIPEDISILHFQVQIYIRCTFIHKVHKEQIENSFLEVD
jgi:hypothetical protein